MKNSYKSISKLPHYENTKQVKTCENQGNFHYDKLIYTNRQTSSLRKYKMIQTQNSVIIKELPHTQELILN